MGKAGIIYIMTTSVNGLIKIGKTDNFKARMTNLMQNGYWNVSGLQPYFAVKVKNYDEKEKLIHTIFSKSQVSTSELFALDKKVAKELLESFEGEQVFPDTSRPTTPVINPPKKEKFTFAMLDIPVNSSLVYILDDSITCTTVDTKNMVRYNGVEYTLSGLVSFLKGGGSWQGSAYFSFEGEKLIDRRDRMGK